MKRTIIVMLFMATFFWANAHAEIITPGNLLISSDNMLYEYTLAGDLVSSFPTEYPDGYPSTEYARDIAADASGNIYYYNGTFYPYMSIYESSSAIWHHFSYDGFSTVNNGSYGGIDIFNTTVFGTDMYTAQGGEAQGVVAFDIPSGQALRFASGIEPIDLTIGMDGLLYVLSPGGSPEGTVIDIYDPVSLIQIDSIDLTAIFGWTGHRSIAVESADSIFIADWDGEVHHINSAGDIVDTIVPTCTWSGREMTCSFIDIDLSENGQIALGSRLGEIFITDTLFSSVTKFVVGGSSAFVEFVPNEKMPQPVVSIDMDIKPNRYWNLIKPTSQRPLPVALLTTQDFDATSINLLSIAFGPAGAAPITDSGVIIDVDSDGDEDYVVYFSISETGIQCGDTSASITGETLDGQSFEGGDTIYTRGCRSN